MNAKMKKALACLLTEPDKTRAAAAANISTATLRLYMRNPEFLKAYNEAVSELLSDAVTQSKKALAPAIATLQNIALDEEEASNNRISASRSLIEYGCKLIEAYDLISKIEELEAKMQEGEKNGN